MNNKSFHDVLSELTDEYAHRAYTISRRFPKEESYGLTSQLRRAALSVPLNYREGFARRKPKSYIHFLEIAYGSLKESQYLLHFSYKENLIDPTQFEDTVRIGERVGGMIWSLIRKLEQNSNDS